ncbi:MAG: type II secretion system protein GspM [Gammaproteobacteria bacterium]|nr:type II secretion system protein GspM [Gammaproteobacteria bacterium]MDH4253911.1 type II secretion system protein GspM [Gammaproteobacteria bacterium]MDH5310691.1 type II secretion system protein GspM [Gammaproteobacteria bacterium]
MTLNPSQSRALALALLAGVVAVLLSAIAWPVYATLQRQSTALAQEERQLAVYTRLAAARPGLEAELASLRRRSPALDYFVQGETVPLASANMQKLVQTLIDRNGAEAVSSLALPPREEQEPGFVGIKVHLRADMKGAIAILHALESGNPRLFVQNLMISARPVRGAKPGDPPDIQLDMQFDLEGYIHDDSTAKATAI